MQQLLGDIAMPAVLLSAVVGCFQFRNCLRDMVAGGPQTADAPPTELMAMEPNASMLAPVAAMRIFFIIAISPG